MTTVDLVPTLVTTERENRDLRDRRAAAGVATTLVDLGIKSDASHADVTPREVAQHHPDGPYTTLAVRDDVLVLCHGGPIAMPDDAPTCGVPRGPATLSPALPPWNGGRPRPR